ncbi:DNA-binding protein [Zoogloea sp. LCSB751]|uniref:DNA-binding protein n=1 Tax=Zoogloea sp. LCSB751 TaxID=1965277 RepID=UPI0009A481D7|nr:DNA-binding protein [Zoogloea sp. LCSB751]
MQTMARAGIYKSEVVRARDKLIALGKHPSIDAIRVELGNTGSRTTISRYLKEIEEEDGAVTGSKVAVSESLLDLVGRLAERLHGEANARVSEAETRHSKRLQDAQAQSKAATEEAESFRQQLEECQLALVREREAHKDTQKALREETLARTQVAQQVSDLQERLAAEEEHRQSLEEKHQHSREALAHFRQSVKEQRDQELRQHDQQVAYLQGEIRSLQEVGNKKQHELIHAHQECSRLASELAGSSTSLRQAKAENRSLKKERDELIFAQQRLHEVEQRALERGARIGELLERNQGLEAGRAALEERIQQLSLELATSRATAAAQEAVIERIQGDVAELVTERRKKTQGP